ncbi:TPA: Rha family transcriptional regulator [Escherichia coli]
MNASLVISTESPKVFFSHDRLVTTSQAIADYFDKQHKHILEKIRSLDCSPEFTTANFSAVVIKVQAGFMEKDAEGFEVTKDGFMFLVMGFTGKKAARLKEAYIAKFNKMEAELCKPVATQTYAGIYEIVTTIRDSVPVDVRIGRPGEMFISIESYADMMERAGYVLIHSDELEQLTLVELAKKAQAVKQTMNKWLSTQ